jgi:methyl-accepting chemotaxis protein
MKIAMKLPILVVLAAFSAIASIGISNYITASTELEEASERQLVALAHARKNALEFYLGSIREDLQIVAANETVETAMREFTNAFTFAGGGASSEAALQAQYIKENPNPTGEKHRLDRAPEDTEYNRLHGRFHPWFRQLLEERGYYDIFLVSPNGDVIYTVYKELDYATNLLNGQWRDSDLGNVFRAAQSNGSQGAIAFTDFAPYAPSNGAAASFIATPMFDGGRFLGALVYQMPVDRINQIMQVSEGMGESGETYLVGDDLLMRSDSRFSDESTILKTEVDTATVKRALAGEAGFDIVPDYRGIPVLSAHLSMEFHGVRWALMAEIDEAEVQKPTNAMAGTMAIIAAVVLLLIGAVGIWFARTIARPITAMTENMQVLAGGDMTVEIEGAKRSDEVGDMAKAVQVFKENMIRNVELQAAAEAEQKAQLERGENIEGMIGEFDTGITNILGTVSSAAVELEQTAQSMSSTAEQASGQAASVATASNQASANVQTVATAAEELSASIAEIGRQVNQSAKIAQNAVVEAETTNETVKGLAEAANRIGEVVNLINDIAGQTNLLALNATIEAARAGEAGKGFAVVAQEVKNLANQTAKATEEISSQIGAVQEETNDAVTAIENIQQIIGEISDISTTIASAVEEQGVSTQEIARNVQQAAAGTQEVNSNIGGVTEAASQTGSAATQVLSSSGELARQAEAMRTQVDDFLRDVKTA